VHVVTVDEGADAESASAAAAELLGQNVLAIAGVASPVALSAIAPAIEENKIPLVTAGISPATLTSTFYIWRVSQVEGEAGQALARYARAQGARAYVLRDNSTTAAEEASKFANAFRNLDRPGTITGVSVGTDGFPDRLDGAVSAGADTIFAAFTGEAAGSLLAAYAASGLDIKLIGPGSLTETVDLGRLRRLPTGVYTSMYYAPDIDNENNRRFVASYHQRHGQQPSTSAMAAYDCASVIDKALRLVEGDPTPADLNRAFSLLGQIESPRGVWAFNINRTPQQKWYLRHLAKDGTVPGNLLDTDLAVLS
jgi:branched-chain amino acid transport system substrate-binding protein